MGNCLTPNPLRKNVEGGMTNDDFILSPLRTRRGDKGHCRQAKGLVCLTQDKRNPSRRGCSLLMAVSFFAGIIVLPYG
jgi:hypothetical protein